MFSRVALNNNELFRAIVFVVVVAAETPKFVFVAAAASALLHVLTASAFLLVFELIQIIQDSFC